MLQTNIVRQKHWFPAYLPYFDFIPKYLCAFYLYNSIASLWLSLNLGVSLENNYYNNSAFLIH